MPTYSSPNFKKLLHQSNLGSDTAWKTILEQIEPAVLTFIRLKMGPKVRSLEQSWDVYQSSLEEAWKKLKQFRGDDLMGFRSWIMTIAEHKIVDILRLRGALKRGGGNDVSLEINIAGNETGQGQIRDALEGREDTPSKVSMGKELKSKLEDYIRELPEHQREMILLRNYLCLTPEQIAERIGKTSGWVRKTHFDALKHLREKMKEHHSCWKYIQRK